MKWIRKHKMWFSAIMAVILFAASSAVYLQYSKGAKAAAVKETIYDVKTGDIRSSVTGTSQLEPKNMQIIASESAATIKKMNLTKNMQVKQGDVLVEFSNPTVEADVEKAESTLTSLEKDLADIQSQMGESGVTSPISGKLTLTGNIDVGTTVGKTAKIGTVSNNKTLLLTVPFAYEDAKQLTPGDPADLQIDNFMLTKTGRVQSIGTEARGDMKGGKLLDVSITIENDATMDAGLKASVSIVKDNRSFTSKEQGVMQYSQIVNLLTNVTGTISELNAKTGDTVQAGQTIAVISNDTLNDQLAAKKSAIDQQKLAVQDAKDKLDALVLKAPFDGVFSTDFVNKKADLLNTYTPGTKVPSGTQFGGLASLDNMQLPIQVDELDLPNVKVGMTAEVKVDSVGNRIFPAEVSQVSSVGTTTNGVTFFDVVLSVKNTDQLKYGMTATGEILFQDRKGVVVIPVEALQRSKGKTYVSFKKADGTTDTQHEITVGARSKTQVEVTSGLKAGDKIVIPQLQTQTKLSQQELNQLRQQFQGGAGGGNLSPDQINQLRQQFQGGQGGGGQGGAGGAGGNAGGGARASRGQGGGAGN